MKGPAKGDRPSFYPDPSVQGNGRLLVEQYRQGIAEDGLQIQAHGHRHEKSIFLGDKDRGVEQGMTGMLPVDR